MIKFVVFNMDASLTWPCRQRDNDYSDGARNFDTYRYRVALIGNEYGNEYGNERSRVRSCSR